MLPRNNKRVTFIDSPVDTPSNVRTRSSEYSGITFADVRREELNDQVRSSDVLRSKEAELTKCMTLHTALQVKEAELDRHYHV
jgi:hypothetical protein